MKVQQNAPVESFLDVLGSCQLQAPLILGKLSILGGHMENQWGDLGSCCGHLHGPDLNEPRPAAWTAVQCPPRLLALRAVSLAEADQTRERPLPTGSKHGRAIVSSRPKVLFRTQGVSVPLRPPELGLWQHHQGDHWAC